MRQLLGEDDAAIVQVGAFSAYHFGGRAERNRVSYAP